MADLGNCTGSGLLWGIWAKCPSSFHLWRIPGVWGEPGGDAGYGRRGGLRGGVRPRLGLWRGFGRPLHLYQAAVLAGAPAAVGRSGRSSQARGADCAALAGWAQAAVGSGPGAVRPLVLRHISRSYYLYTADSGSLRPARATRRAPGAVWALRRHRSRTRTRPPAPIIRDIWLSRWGSWGSFTID